MIYNYEAEILRFVNKCIPEIKLSTYAEDEDLLTALDTIKQLPAFYYKRDSMEVEWNKPIKTVPSKDYPYHFTFYPYQQKYSGTILVENVQTALQTLTKLKYHFNDNSKIYVRVPGLYELEKELTPVSLWLTGISVEEMRAPNDKIGAMRAVRFTWQSNLLLADRPTNPEGLVEEVHLDFGTTENIKGTYYIDDEGEIHYDESTLNHPINGEPVYHGTGDPIIITEKTS